MFFDEYLLVDPKASDSEETKRNKELINHAALTYLRLQILPNLAERFFGGEPSQQFGGTTTPDSATLSVLMNIGNAGKKALGIGRFLTGK